MRLPSASAQMLLRRSLQRPNILSHSLPFKTLRRPQSTHTKTSNSSSSNEVPKQEPRSHASQSPPSPIHTRVLSTLLIPLRAYGRTQQRRPYLTQILSILTIYTLGDLSAQNLASYNTNTTFLASYDPFKTLRAMIIGAVISIPSYHWFLFLGTSRFSITLPSSLLPFLSRWTAPKGAASSGTLASKETVSAAAKHIYSTANFILSISNRVITNQIVFSPIFLIYFFTAHSLLTPLVCASPALAALPSTRELRAKLVETVPTSFVNSWKLWPAVTAVSFTVVQPQYRAVFAGAVAIGWQTYLGVLNLRAEKMTEEEEEESLEQPTINEDRTSAVVPVKAAQEDVDSTKAAHREGRVALVV